MSAADGSTPQVVDPFTDGLDTLAQVEDRHLWPPEADFSKACSCDECRQKIKALKEFENEIKAKSRLVSEYSLQLDYKEDICFSICNCIYWTKRMLNLFQKKLLEVSKDQSKFDSAAANNLELIDDKIIQMLRDIGLIGEPDDSSSALALALANTDVGYDIPNEIKSGLDCYGKTKAKDKAYALIRGIEKLEKEAQNKNLDPAVSMKCIEKQIELVKGLPVEELQIEVGELIEQIHPRDIQLSTLRKARECISGICWPLIRKRKEFWRRYPATDNNDHWSNGLKETLDSLMETVNLFEDLWNKDFAHFFTRYVRSDSKRQRVDCARAIDAVSFGGS